MNRRQLLRLTAGVSAGIVATIALSGRAPQALAEASFAGRRFRGLADGRLLESDDNGSTWRLNARFGEHCAITRIAEHNGEMVLRLEVQGYPFFLRSSDARIWRTWSAAGAGL